MQNPTMKKFMIISVVLFLSITVVGTLLIINKEICNNDNCEKISGQFIQFLIILISAIGVTYGLLLIKQFDTKLDTEVMDNIKELTDYEIKKDKKTFLT